MERTGLQKGSVMERKNFTKTALDRAMAICARREYSAEDLRIKLSSWGLKSDEAERIITTLIKENFLNETRFASAFVKDKYRNNKWGKLKILSHLRAKKIDPQIIDKVLNELDKDQYRKMVRNVVLSHRRFIKAKNQFDLKGKLLRYGLSKGFEGEILYEILNDIE